MTDRKPATNVAARKLPTAPATKLRGWSVIRCIQLLDYPNRPNNNSATRITAASQTSLRFDVSPAHIKSSDGNTIATPPTIIAQEDLLHPDAKNNAPTAMKRKAASTTTTRAAMIKPLEARGSRFRNTNRVTDPCLECFEFTAQTIVSNDPKLSHGHRSVTPECNRDNQISYHRRNARRGGRWLQRGVEPSR